MVLYDVLLSVSHNCRALVVDDCELHLIDPFAVMCDQDEDEYMALVVLVLE
jgi:hypothetical protein